MFVHNLNPVLFQIGKVQIRYYGLLFVLGALIVYFFIKKLVKERDLKLSKDDVDLYVIYLLIGVIIGSRLFYVLIYNLKFYLQNPLLIFALWQGGLSFHGGLVGAIVAAYIFCKKKNVSLQKMGDITIIPLGLALMLGRIGNFINAELYGRITDIAWCVKFPNVEGCRHPSQLYEAFKNLFIFVVLYNIRNKKFKDGFIFWLFVLMYATLRFFIEFFRAPDPQLGFIVAGLTMGQILNIIMFFIALFFINKVR